MPAAIRFKNYLCFILNILFGYFFHYLINIKIWHYFIKKKIFLTDWANLKLKILNYRTIFIALHNFMKHYTLISKRRVNQSKPNACKSIRYFIFNKNNKYRHGIFKDSKVIGSYLSKVK